MDSINIYRCFILCNKGYRIWVIWVTWVAWATWATWRRLSSGTVSMRARTHMRQLFYFFTPAYDYATQCETWFVLEEMRANNYIGAAPHSFFWRALLSTHTIQGHVALLSRLPLAQCSEKLFAGDDSHSRKSLCNLHHTVVGRSVRIDGANSEVERLHLVGLGLKWECMLPARVVEPD